jgi:putative hydrolase of the HAD superfamily
MPELKAIFFDIDDTLYSTSEFAAQARRNAVDAMIAHGLRMERDDVLREFREVVEEFGSNYEGHFDKLLLRLPRRAWEGANPSVLVAAGVGAYHDTKFRQLSPFQDALEVLRLLAQTKLIRGIITHGLAVKQAEKLIRLRVYQYLTPSAIFISDQIGISKPNPKLYQRACETIGVPPSQAMYIGDNPRNDIDPPNAIGMITARHRWGTSGRHGAEVGATRPHHEISSFWNLLEILRSQYGIAV